MSGVDWLQLPSGAFINLGLAIVAFRSAEVDGITVGFAVSMATVEPGDYAFQAHIFHGDDAFVIQRALEIKSRSLTGNATPTALARARTAKKLPDDP